MKKLLVFLLLPVFTISCNRNDNKINFEPIGYFSTKYTLQTGAPRQGTLVPESKGVIIMDSTYIKGLTELNDFEYIWVLYYFNKAKSYDLIISPPNSHHKFGVFATRSPRRPNPIGLSLVKLDSIVENRLYINDVDAFDKTPVLDIKPFLPSVDYVNSKRNIDAEIYLGHHNNDYINDSLINEFVLGKP